MNKELVKKIKILAVAGFIVIVIAFLKLFFSQQFDSVESFQTYMQKFGIFGPIVLTLFQAFQVVVPVLPGYLGQMRAPAPIKAS